MLTGQAKKDDMRDYYAENKEIQKEKWKAASKRYYEANKDKVKAQTKAWFKANPNKFKEYSKNWRHKNLQKVLLINAKRNAKNTGREFSITLEDIELPTHCPILGIPLVFGGERQEGSYSVDRVDSTKGYIKGNVRTISFLANRMKTDATKEQLLSFAKNIVSYLDT